VCASRRCKCECPSVGVCVYVCVSVSEWVRACLITTVVSECVHCVRMRVCVYA